MTAPSIPADSRNYAIPDCESPPIQSDASCARERGRMGSSSVFLLASKGSLMLRIGIISALVLGLNPGIRGTALAADKAPSPCKPLAKLWADFDAKTHFTTLTPGQFHFVEGIYVGSPTTPDGLPPGDGAL